MLLLIIWLLTLVIPRWTDDIAEWTWMKINEAAAAAEDRDRLRGILRAANPSYGGWH